MVGYVRPGFLCGTSADPIDEGTLCRMRSSPPGPLRETLGDEFRRDPSRFVRSDDAVLLAGPALPFFRKSIVRWCISDYGHAHGFLFSGGQSEFFTVGHNELSCLGTIVQFNTRDTNCFGYALGHPIRQGIWPQLSNPKIKKEKEARLLLAPLKGEVPEGGVLPFGSPVPEGFFAVDLWQGQGADANGPVHATARIPAGGGCVVISKDGFGASVQNVRARELSSAGQFRTNAGVCYMPSPCITLLIPCAAVGNWSELRKAFDAQR